MRTALGERRPRRERRCHPDETGHCGSGAPGRYRRGALALGLLALAALAGCGPGTERAPLETVPYVDLARYQGRWYEIARLPMWFQRGCLQSEALYEVVDATTVAVTNRCPTASGATKTATGRATVVDPQTNARLEVEFDNWFSRLFPGVARGDYWVLYLDPDYTLALVGEPGRRYLWVLSRSPTLDEDRYREVVALAGRLGFPTGELLRPAPGPAAR
jgi:apolipoprotein D and lipocalin family protein